MININFTKKSWYLSSEKGRTAILPFSFVLFFSILQKCCSRDDKKTRSYVYYILFLY
nr:MAG TPA: hypothetical protein [Caudoviricetes sp.]